MVSQVVSRLYQGSLLVQGSPDEVRKFVNAAIGEEGVPDGQEQPVGMLSANAFLPIPVAVKGRFYCKNCGRPPTFDSDTYPCPSCGQLLISAGLEWADENWGTSIGLIAVRKTDAPTKGHRVGYAFQCDKMPRQLFISISKVYSRLLFTLRFQEALGIERVQILDRELKLQAGQVLQDVIKHSPY